MLVELYSLPWHSLSWCRSCWHQDLRFAFFDPRLCLVGRWAQWHCQRVPDDRKWCRNSYYHQECHPEQTVQLLHGQCLQGIPAREMEKRVVVCKENATTNLFLYWVVTTMYGYMKEKCFALLSKVEARNYKISKYFL